MSTKQFVYRSHKATDLAKRLLEIEFDSLSEFHQEIELWSTTALHDFEERVHAAAAQFPEALKGEYLEHWSDDHWKYSEVFPQLARRSAFLVSWSCLEGSLILLCRTAHQDGVVTLSLSSGQAKYIFAHAESYLRTGNAIPKLSFGREWNRLNRYRLVRNRIVHHDGRIDVNPVSDNAKVDARRLRLFIGREPTLSLDNRKRVLLGDQFCENFVGEARKWCVALANRIVQVSVRRHRSAKSMTP